MIYVLCASHGDPWRSRDGNTDYVHVTDST